MNHWTNKNLHKKNVVRLVESTIFVYSVDVEKLEAENHDELQLPKPDLLIPLSEIDQLQALSTDTDLDITHTSGKDKDTDSLEFDSESHRNEFLSTLETESRGQIKTESVQLTPFQAASGAMISLIVALAAIAVYLNKIPWVALSVGGIWAAFSAWVVYLRYTNPHIKTQWQANRTRTQSAVHWFQLARAWGFVLALVFVGATVIPDQNGSHVIYDHVAKDMLSQDNIENLLQRGGDLDFADSEGNTALHLLVDQSIDRAYEIGNDLVMGALMQAATDKPITVNEDKLGNAPEKLAIALLENGANPNAQNNDGESVLEYALRYYADDALSGDLFVALIEHGADTDFEIYDMTVTEYLEEYPILDARLLANHLNSANQ